MPRAKKTTKQTIQAEPQWKRIRAWPNYEASEDGRIRNRATKREIRAHKQGPNSVPWLALSRDTASGIERKSIRLDVLVASAWGIRSTKRKAVLAHLNGNKSDCAAANLEYRAA